MKLVFYGGGHEEENILLDQYTISLAERIDPRITYIPSCSYNSELYFQSFVHQWQDYGVTRFLYFPIDIPFDNVLKKEVFSSDIIHLSGGNTYYFLKYLRSSGLMKDLIRFVERGGVLTGLSAGGILMTPTIKTAGYPEFDCDENSEKLRNLKSLGLVRFEFFPHYRNSKRFDRELIRESKKLKYPIYASTDGSGVIINGVVTKFVGRNFCFYRGQKFPISIH